MTYSLRSFKLLVLHSIACAMVTTFLAPQLNASQDKGIAFLKDRFERSMDKLKTADRQFWYFKDLKSLYDFLTLIDYSAIGTMGVNDAKNLAKRQVSDRMKNYVGDHPEDDPSSLNSKDIDILVETITGDAFEADKGRIWNLFGTRYWVTAFDKAEFHTKMMGQFVLYSVGREIPPLPNPPLSNPPEMSPSLFDESSYPYLLLMGGGIALLLFSYRYASHTGESQKNDEKKEPSH